ncbi:fibronectin type III domain-containing protein [Allokutzneria multivorans]|uniref:Fibronectin type III domain-containing protein n=2 Tax=Allokutzneria multivorans TaxID=1142134 RepID=A0ABP7RX47_9PSEU
MLSPNDIALEWRGSAMRAVEFATSPDGPYTVLQFAPPSQNTYKHPDLMPRTPFYYRLRTIHGPVSGLVPVSLPPGDFDESADHSWAPPRVVLSGAVRSPGAAPTDLRAEVKHANGILFTWTDNASDEEGYLVEVRAEGAAEFRVAAVLDADVNSFGLVTLEEEKVAEYRVRAYYSGEVSNVVRLVTGG